MATKKKMLQAAAGQAGGAGLDITDVFSTYLYEGNGTSQTITNGIDLSGEGGLVWFKNRPTGNTYHALYDTERGTEKYLMTNVTSAEQTFLNNGVTSFNADGFTVAGTSDWFNASGQDIASWTFRKAPKFFTMVTWSGNSTMGRTISHDLGADVGFILIKAVDKADAWYALHKDSNMLVLNQTTAEYSDATTADYFGDGTNIVRPTSTEFTIGSDAGINGTGYNYIAYLFAHNDGDGEFGPDGDQDIIKCGTYEGNGGTQEIDLGFEPQWVMIKNIESRSYQASLDWNIFDNMRNWANRTSGDNDVLIANGADAETALARCFPTANGFAFYNDGAYSLNFSGDTYIYIAIRRGPLAQPESGTEVFAIDTAAGTSPTPPTFVSGFPVDFSFYKNKTDSSNNWNSQNRLTGDADLAFNTTSAEFTNGGTYWEKDYMNGIGSNTGTNSNGYQWMWKRAPGFFDVVAYTGNGTAGHTVSHNLGVAPEMMWVKRRESTGVWGTYHSGVDATSPEDFYLKVESTGARVNDARFWNDTAPDDTVFTLGTHSQVNFSGGDYIAYLFASLPGISKVGSYTGNGTSQTIDCGFTSGARFVLLKVASTDDDWFLWDSVRGINAGAEPYLRLNVSSAEITTNDRMDPHPSGFAVDGNDTSNNKNGETYIFYAIA